jgi:integrase
MKPKYTSPTIYTANGDTRQRWHIEFWYTLPTGEKKRYRVRGNVNRIKNKDERYKQLIEIQKYYTELLQSGWSPVSDVLDTKTENHRITIYYCLNKIIEYKKSYASPTYFRTFRSRVRLFADWLLSEQIHQLHPAQITRIHIIEFITYLSNVRRIGNRTRNNYLCDLTTAFDEMIKYDSQWVQLNPCEHVNRVPTRSNLNEPYDSATLKLVSDYMRDNNRNLYRFCRMFMYLGIRPIEAVKMKVGDINLKTGKFFVPASNEKTGLRKHKPIVQFIKDELEYLNDYPEEYYIFSTKGIPSPQPTTRDYFTKEFNKVKQKLKLPSKFTMYGLKHTFIVELEKSGMPHHDIMKITGHRTLTALQAYLQKYYDANTNFISDEIIDIMH